eukprot:442457-Rhodomonas_salina.3
MSYTELRLDICCLMRGEGAWCHQNCFLRFVAQLFHQRGRDTDSGLLRVFALQSAIFNFQSLLIVILLTICTCAYIHANIPRILDGHKTGSALILCCLCGLCRHAGSVLESSENRRKSVALRFCMLHRYGIFRPLPLISSAFPLLGSA